MKKIQILGTGCAKCNLLYERTKSIAISIGMEFTIEKVSDPVAIASFDVLSTPALVVDGIVKISGKVPHEDEIREMIL